MHHSDIDPGLFSGYLLRYTVIFQRSPGGEALLPLKAYTCFHTKFCFNSKSLISGYGEASPERCTFFRLQQSAAFLEQSIDTTGYRSSVGRHIGRYIGRVSARYVDRRGRPHRYIDTRSDEFTSHLVLNTHTLHQFNTTSFQIRLFCLFRSLSFSKLFAGLDMNFC